MSDTHLHKQKARFRNKIDEFEDTSISFKKYCNRANSDKSRQTERRNKLRYQ